MRVSCGGHNYHLAGKHRARWWKNLINDPLGAIQDARINALELAATIDALARRRPPFTLFDRLEAACGALLDHDGERAVLWTARAALELWELAKFDRSRGYLNARSVMLEFDTDYWQEAIDRGGPADVALRDFWPLWLIDKEDDDERETADLQREKILHSLTVSPFLPAGVRIRNGELIFEGWRWIWRLSKSLLAALGIGFLLGYWFAP